jgi:inner membrane protein
MMDILTHGLTGALLGRALSNNIKKLKPKTFILIGAFAAIFPDFDFLFILKSTSTYLEYHRSITHSLILLPIWAFLISLFFSWLLRNKILLHKNWIEEGSTNKAILKEVYLLSFLSILSHILSDVITDFGIMLLSPFINTRFEIGNMYMIDFWFSGIVLTGILASWFIKKDSYLMARIFFIFLLGYISLAQHSKFEAERYALLSLRAVHPNPSKLTIYSNPMPFSPYNWSITAYDSEKDVYYNSKFSLNEVKIMRNNTWQTIKRWGNNNAQESIAKLAWNDPSFSMYRWFIKIPAFYSVIKRDTKICVYFQDLKFSQPDHDNPYIYGICLTKDGKKYNSRLVQGVDNSL